MPARMSSSFGSVRRPTRSTRASRSIVPNWDDGPDRALVEGIGLHDDDGSAEPRRGTGRITEVSPRAVALADHHSLDSRIVTVARRTNAPGTASSRRAAIEASIASVTSSGACRATYSRSAVPYTSLRDRPSRRARRSARSNTSGTDTAIFIPAVADRGSIDSVLADDSQTHVELRSGRDARRAWGFGPIRD